MSKLSFFALGLLLWLCSFSVSSDVILSDEEFNELMGLQIQQESILTQQGETISTLENELTAAKNLQATQGETIETLSTLTDALKRSLETLSHGQKTSLNLGGGFYGDHGPGMYIGIEIELF